MKRSSLLSAFMVGLSLTCVGAAAAAPPGADKTDKLSGSRMMAQADPPLNRQSDPASGAPGTAAPSAAPNASGDPTQPSQPGVTVGAPNSGGAPTDTPQTAAASAAAKPKPRPFAGSALFLQQSMTTNTIFKGQTQYANPTVETAAIIGPRYAINAAWQLRGRLVVNYEWTNSDNNTYNREPTLSDTNFQLFYRKIPQFAGISTAVALNASVPTSKGSRARTLITTPGVTAQFVRGFEHVLGGDLTFITSFTYSHPLYTSRNPETVDRRPYTIQCAGGSGCGDLLSGAMNVSDTLGYSLIGSYDKGNWNPAFAYIGGTQWAYRPKEVANPVDGTILNRNANATNVRQTHYLAVWLDYNFASWITGEVGYYNAVSGIGLSGTRSNVLFDRYQDTRVYLGASIQLDNLVKALQGTNEGSGGVIRAQAKPPMWTF